MCSSNSKGKQVFFKYFLFQRRILRNISRQKTCSLYRVMQKPVPGENLTKSRSFYCMNLVFFYKDDMLPLVLRSLNIFVLLTHFPHAMHTLLLLSSLLSNKCNFLWRIFRYKWNIPCQCSFTERREGGYGLFNKQSLSEWLETRAVIAFYTKLLCYKIEILLTICREYISYLTFQKCHWIPAFHFYSSIHNTNVLNIH
jgi:hypothetical protein